MVFAGIKSRGGKLKLPKNHGGFSWATIPLALLILLFLSFGLLIPWLGFYWDDWPAVMVARLQGPGGYWAFYQVDRPLSAWTFMVTTPLLGVRPAAWHVFTLLLRWSTVLGLWLSLRLLWPKRAQAAAWIAAIFAIYPAFDLQPVSVAFSQHWITYSLFFLSIAGMLLSQRRPQHYRAFLILGLVAQAAHLFTMEYFVGLELLRPVLLWIVQQERAVFSTAHSSGESAENGQRMRNPVLQVFRDWLPYLVILAIYLLYRLAFLQLPDADAYRPELLSDLIGQPLTGIARFLGLIIPDLLYTLFGAWHQTLDPAKLALDQPSGLFSIGIAGLVAAASAIYLGRLAIKDEDSNASWHRQAFALGALALLLGPLPVWITGKQAVGGLYGSRFALASLFGASLIVVAFLEWLKAGRAQKAIIVAVLLGLAASQHVRTANDFRWSWTKQTGFYWQLHWRAPALRRGTILLSDGEIFPYVGINSTAAALNLLYPPRDEPTDLAYWFSDLYREFGPRDAAKLQAGLPVQRQLRSFWYNGSSRDSLPIFYEPEGGRCLWLLTAKDEANPELPEITLVALPAANQQLVGAKPTSGFPPESIFGSEPEHDWCYYYQKASLARQMGDWEKVTALGDEAEAKGLAPNNPQEWLPFIEAYAQSGRWSQAIEATRHAWRINHDLSQRLCQSWKEIEDRSVVPADQLAEVGQLKERLGCGDKNDQHENGLTGNGG